ncbi:hypothetical protein CBOM_07814 [Ceraceosorus bombacis]|uniref:Uncharacterized protein n=1 Tax=Ceraceosorus bombacis TaxID=401625 RepID=A0A0P1BHF9_9BASI|nr:hypothetical protein CBOM_07814 [Ceraceosorus bombacis]
MAAALPTLPRTYKPSSSNNSRLQFHASHLRILFERASISFPSPSFPLHPTFLLRRQILEKDPE